MIMFDPTDPGTKDLDAFNNANPPPGTTPSSIAALTAHNASSALSRFSLASTGELAPI